MTLIKDSIYYVDLLKKEVEDLGTLLKSFSSRLALSSPNPMAKARYMIDGHTSLVFNPLEYAKSTFSFIHININPNSGGGNKIKLLIYLLNKNRSSMANQGD